MATSVSHFSSAGKQPVALLAELQRVHKTLLQRLAELDQLTRGEVPPRALIINARWNISRASLARRVLWSTIYTQLPNRVSNENSIDLRRLRESDMALLRASAEHVSKWQIEPVMQNWPAYCEASNAIRWKMKAAIGAEKRILYPMLEVAARRTAQTSTTRLT